MIQQCPECGRGVSSEAASCPACGFVPAHRRSSAVAVQNAPGGSEAIGVALLLIPLAATAAIWLWVGTMNMLQDPSGSLSAVVITTILLTAVLMAVEASQLGMGKPDAKGLPSTGPVTWFIACAVLWIVAYPSYLAQRARFGRNSMWVGGLLVALVFVGSAWVMNGLLQNQQKRIENLVNEQKREENNRALRGY